MAHNAASSSSPFTTNFYESTTPRSPSYRTQTQSPSTADAGGLINARSRRSPPTAIVRPNTASPSSSSTSLPRPHFHDAKDPRDLSNTLGVREEFDRSRTVSAGSSVDGHGMRAASRKSEGLGGGALERLTPRASPHAPLLPTQFATTGSRSITSSPTGSSTRPTHLVFPSIDSPLPASPCGSTSFPTRRPSLASPLPPTPIVPSTPFPKTSFHAAAPAPLNLSSSSTLPSATQIRHSHHHHQPTASGSPSSPQPSPPHHPKNSTTTTTTTPPSTASGQAQGQGWSHPQYISVPRPSTGGSTLPDSPSTRAMMKRLLAKPAPISSSSHFSATSGSESEAVSWRSHTHTKRRDASAPPRRGAMSDGEEWLLVGDGGGTALAKPEFDVNVGLSEPNVVGTGQWVGMQSDRNFERVLSPAPSQGESKEKEKEKEKRPRNVLRRRPSANKSANRALSPQPQSQSQPSSPPSASGPHHHVIPAQGPFSPLSLSPFFRASHEPKQTVQPQNSASNSKTHASGRGSPPHDSHHHGYQPKTTTTTTSTSTTTTMRRSMSASAALNHSASATARSTSKLEIPNAALPHSLSPPAGRTAMFASSSSSSLHPPLPSGSSRSTTTGGSSRGSSPARSPIVSTLVPGTPSPTKMTESTSPHGVSGSPSERAREREWGGEKESSSSQRGADREKEKGRVPAVTPAASLIEAYKRQEREREEQRIAMERMKEREGQPLKEERGSSSKEGGGSTPTTGTNTPTALTNKVLLLGNEARSRSAPSSRRNSVSVIPAVTIVGDGVNVGDQKKRSGPGGEKEIGGVEQKRKSSGSGSGNGSGSIGSSLSKGSDHVGRDRRAVAGPGRSEENVAVSSTPKLEDPTNASKTVSSRPPVVRRGLDSSKPASPSSGLHASGDGGEEIVTPYYTVFGSTSGRMVAVGSPEDSKWNTYNQGYWDSTVLGQRTAISTGSTDMEKGKAKESLGRSLSRKVSGRWKKQGGLVVGTLDREEDTRQGRLLSRSSMQERRKGGSTMRRDASEEEKRMQMRNRRSLRLSIDKFSDVVGKELDERLVMPPRLAKEDSGSPGVKPEGDADHGTRLTKAKKADGGSPASGGNRFWKLMRRISVGGLREKYHDTEPPPPVPALPRDLQILHPSRSNDSSLTCLRNEVPKKPSSASSSPSAGKPAAPPKSSRPSPSSPPGPNHPRPSTTTRSSSPVSSDVASSKFFHRNPSAHSSTSSFAEDSNPPPLPKPPHFAQHIIDPSELGKAVDEEGARSPTRTQPPRNIPIPNQRMDEDWSIVRSPSVEFPSLPLPPPRRPAVVNLNSLASKAPEVDRPESPTIPSFSTSDAVNAFPARRLSATLSARSRNSPISTHPSPVNTISPSSSLPTSLPPPPRPLRSAQRPAPAVSVSQSPPIVVIDDIPAGRKSESHARIQHNRRSSGGLSSTSTTRPMRRRSSSIGGTTRSSSRRSMSPPPGGGGSAIDSMFTFRELDNSVGPRRYALTEEEKAEKWDDLMERSARAGGTLHLAAGARELDSDRLG